MKTMRIPVLACLLLAASTLVAQPTTQPSTQPAANLFSMPAARFAETDDANRTLDEANLDTALLAAAVHHATNLARTGEGLPALRHLPRLDDASMLHSREMAKGQWMAHENPDNEELREPVDRVKKVGLDYRFVAENVATHFGIKYESGTPVYYHGPNAYSYQSNGPIIPRHTYWSFAQSLVDAWMNSPGHRANILAKEARFHGSACVPVSKEEEMTTYYCTQLFFDAMPRR